MVKRLLMFQLITSPVHTVFFPESKKVLKNKKKSLKTYIVSYFDFTCQKKLRVCLIYTINNFTFNYQVPLLFDGQLREMRGGGVAMNLKRNVLIIPLANGHHSSRAT